MDPSALIFVALAVAWAVYLIPKALEHHEEGARTRTVERFSATMRVLARREAVNRRTARLVPEGAPVAPVVADAPAADRTASRPPAPVPAPVVLTPVQARARRARAAAAARRRLRVVSLILLVNVVVAALAFFSVVAWAWCAVPLGVLVAWLVACRLMVKRERAAQPLRSRLPAGTPAPTAPAPVQPSDETGSIEPVSVDQPADEPADEPVEAEAPKDPESWDPVPVTLPTYVSKAAAPRSVRTIDLDSTGVWSSGRNESDSALAREAEASDRAAKDSAARERQRRASS